MNNPENSQQEKINIALIVPSLSYGGAERQVVEIARNLDRKLFQASIISLSDYSPILPMEDELRKHFYVIKKYGKLDVTVIPRLAILLRRLNIHLVHSFLFFSEIATRMAASLIHLKPVIGSERNCNYSLAAYRYVVNRLTIDLMDLVVANSTAGAAYHASLYGLPEERYRILHNGVDIDRFCVRDKVQCKRNLGLDPNKVVIGMFASFKKQKNHIYFFKAVKDLIKECNVNLLLVGDTPYTSSASNTQSYKAQLMNVIREYDLKESTIILGNRTDVERIYSACDITVLSSLHEGTPNVVLESFACGVPAVITNVSDNAQIVIDGKEGYIVPVDDVAVFSEKLKRLCVDAELRNAMAVNARRAAEERLSTKVMSQKIADIYSTAISECKGFRGLDL
ncbi:MAG: glycosyltransferase [Exilibacterium sp.]